MKLEFVCQFNSKMHNWTSMLHMHTLSLRRVKWRDCLPKCKQGEEKPTENDRTQSVTSPSPKWARGRAASVSHETDTMVLERRLRSQQEDSQWHPSPALLFAYIPPIAQ